MGNSGGVPEKLRGIILKDLHQGHPSVSRIKATARSYLWWLGLDKDGKILSDSSMFSLGNFGIHVVFEIIKTPAPVSNSILTSFPLINNWFWRSMLNLVNNE